MYTIYALVQCIFTVYVVVYVANSTFAGDNNSLLIVFPSVFMFGCFRTYEERIHAVFIRFVAVATAGFNFGYLSYGFPLYATGTQSVDEGAKVGCGVANRGGRVSSALP